MSNSRIVKAGAGYTISNILIKGISFLTIPVFSRLLSTSGYGLYSTYTAYSGIINILLSLGLYPTLKNAMIDLKDRLQEYVSTITWIMLIALGISSAMLAIFHEGIVRFVGLPLPLVILLLLTSFGEASVQLFNSQLSLNYEYKKYIIIACIKTFSDILLSLLLVLSLVQEYKAYGKIIGYSFSFVVLGLVIVFSDLKQGNFKFRNDYARYGLAIGLPLIWHLLAQQIQSQVDRIMITRLTSDSYTGIYSLIYNVAVIFQVIYSSLNTVFSVWFYKKMAEHAYSLIRKTLKIYILLLTVVCAVMIMGSREFIYVFADEKYWVGADLFFPIVIGIFMLFEYSVVSLIEYYLKRTKAIATMTTIAAIVNVVANYIFIQSYGYQAAAYTTLLSYTITFLGHWFIAKKLAKEIGAADIFRFIDFLFPALFLALVAVFSFYTKDVPVIKYVVLLLLLIVCCIKWRKEIRSAFMALHKTK